MATTKAAPSPAPSPAPTGPSAADLIAAIVAASAAANAATRGSRGASDPWAGLARPLTDSEQEAIAKLAEVAQRFKIKGWNSYRDSRDFYSVPLNAVAHVPTLCNLANATPQTVNNALFNQCIYALLQRDGQVWIGTVARLAVAFDVALTTVPKLCQRMGAVTNIGYKWVEGWFIGDIKEYPRMDETLFQQFIALGVKMLG